MRGLGGNHHSVYDVSGS